MIGLIGKKLGMTQIFQPDGTVVPVTVIQAGPCTVVQKKMPERDGYGAVQMGFGPQKIQRTTKAMKEHCRGAGQKVFMVLREFRIGDVTAYQMGQEVTVDAVFHPGDLVDVIGITKGRGFAGVIKRHGFGGFPASHGTHEYFRHGGSIGCRSFPGRVLKGKRMAGRYGNERITVQNLRVMDVKSEDNLLLVKGSVPGSRHGLLLIRKPVRGRSHG